MCARARVCEGECVWVVFFVCLFCMPCVERVWMFFVLSLYVIYSRTIASIANVFCWLYPTLNKVYLILSFTPFPSLPLILLFYCCIFHIQIDWVFICMFSQMEYCSKTLLKIISNDRKQRKSLVLHHWTFTSMMIIMLKSWYLWWLFGSDVWSSYKGFQTWKNMSIQKCLYKEINFNAAFDW